MKEVKRERKRISTCMRGRDTVPPPTPIWSLGGTGVKFSRVLRSLTIRFCTNPREMNRAGMPAREAMCASA